MSEPYWFSDPSLTRPKRAAWAKQGVALKDGSFPIPSTKYLKKAMRAVGRATNRTAAVAHIKRRARALGATNLLTPAFRGSDAVLAFNELITSQTITEAFAEIDTAHKHDHFHDETGITHDHPHGHSDTDADDHDTDLHHVHHQVASAYGDALIYADLLAGVSVRDHGADTTSAVAASEPDALEDGDPDDGDDPVPPKKPAVHANAEPTASDVHVPGPLGNRQRPGGRADSPLRRVIATLAGTDRKQRLASERAVAERFWSEPKTFCACSAGEASFCEMQGFCEGSAPMGEPDDDGIGGVGDGLNGAYVDDSSLANSDDDDDADDGAQPLFEKSDALIQYRDATDPQTACNTCRFFVRGAGMCRLVEGAIRSTGVCNLQKPVQIDAGAFSERSVVQFDPGAPKKPVVQFNIADLCGHGLETVAPSRLFVELPANAWQKFVEVGNRLPYLPKPGVYTHKKYGTVVISRERNQRFVENMNNHVYQSRIPLDLEHGHQFSGAAAWITSLVANPDGSADAMVEIEPMGQTMLSENRFLFISPEWLDEWTQPHTNKVFKDVPIGGALTTRPFFKEESLRSLVASERGLTVYNRPRAGDGGNAVTTPTTAPQQSNVPAPAATPQPVQMSEDVARQFAEMQARVEKAEKSSEQYAERLEKQETATRHKLFTDEVLGRSDENNIRWFGELDKHVTHLEDLTKAFGEESPQVKHYVETERAHARQMSESALLKPQGIPGVHTSDVSGTGKLAMAIKRVKEAEPKLTNEQAFSRAFTEDPTLYNEYLEQNPIQRYGYRP